jgi:hypothetical protein
MKIPFVDEPRDPLEAIQFFIEQAEDVHEYDYGDCMREWNRDILYLKKCWQKQKVSPWALHRLDDIQTYVQFIPNWDVELTKARLLKDAHEIEEHLNLAKNSGRAA